MHPHPPDMQRVEYRAPEARDPEPPHPREISIATAQANGPLSYVPETEGDYFKVDLQLGSHRKWRRLRGGKVIRNEKGDKFDKDGKLYARGWLHRSAIHTGVVVSREILNGLIGEHNEFLKANADPQRITWDERGAETTYLDPRATPGKLLFVLSYTPTDEPPPELTFEQRLLMSLDKLTNLLLLKEERDSRREFADAVERGDAQAE